MMARTISGQSAPECFGKAVLEWLNSCEGCLLGKLTKFLGLLSQRRKLPLCIRGRKRVVRTEKDIVQVSVRDEGVGLPSGFDPPTSKRLGSRLINALAKQLGAELIRPVSAIGTNFMLLIPLGSATADQSLHAEM